MQDLLDRLERMGDAIPKYAKAKADRVYIEHFRKSKIAMLMTESKEKTSVAKEAEALRHPDYIALLSGLREAVEIEEKHKWTLEQVKMGVDVWRTEQANERYIKDRI